MCCTLCELVLIRDYDNEFWNCYIGVIVCGYFLWWCVKFFGEDSMIDCIEKIRENYRCWNESKGKT